MVASPVRFVARADRRGGTTLVFAMNRPGRFVIQVLGQAPDCRVLGSFTRRVPRGMSRVRFNPFFGGTVLRPGTYTLVPYVIGRQQRRRLASVTVQIVPSNRRLPAAERRRPLRAQCSFAPIGGSGTGGTLLVSSPLGSAWSAGFSGATVKGSTTGVAGVSESRKTLAVKVAAVDDLPVLSAIIPEDSPVPPPVLALIALVAIALGMFALVVSLIRFMRGSWNP